MLAKYYQILAEFKGIVKFLNTVIILLFFQNGYAILSSIN